VDGVLSRAICILLYIDCQTANRISLYLNMKAHIISMSSYTLFHPNLFYRQHLAVRMSGRGGYHST